MVTRQKIFVGLIMGCLLLIGVLTFFHYDSPINLYGISNEVAAPQFEPEGLWKGDYQNAVGVWYKNNFPLRPCLVRLNNQLLYMSKSKINNDIIVGKDGWLMSDEYADSSFFPLGDVYKDSYRNYAQKIKMLEEKLSGAGKKLIYVISPSKAELYAEYLPSRYFLLMKDRDKVLNSYKYQVECFDNEDIDYIDMTAILKENNTYPAFSKTGIHWNYWAAALCASEVIAKSEYCEQPRIIVNENKKPQGTEQDIYMLSNIIRGTVDDKYYWVSVDYPDINISQKKRLLEMGTSFSGELASCFRENEECIWSKYTRYEYFAQKYTFIGDHFTYETGDSYIPDSHYEFVDLLLSIPDEELAHKEGVNLDETDLVIDFSVEGNSEQYVRTGFYAMENKGRWSKNYAEMSLPIYCATGDIVLDLSENRFYDNTTIEFNDTVVWQSSDGVEKLKKIIIPNQLVYNGDNYITITTQDEILSPKDLGISEDTRILAHWWGSIRVASDVMEEE